MSLLAIFPVYLELSSRFYHAYFSSLLSGCGSRLSSPLMNCGFDATIHQSVVFGCWTPDEA
jgi:hypothetical protein